MARFLWFGLAIALSLGSAVRAEPPDGAYVIAIPSPLGLTAATGDAEVCETEDNVETCLSTSVSTDATGAISGSGALTLEELAGEFAGTMALEVTGQVGGSIDAPKPVLDFGIEGEILEPDEDPNMPVHVLSVSGTGRMKCKLDPGTDPNAPDLLSCKGKARFCAVDERDRPVGCARMPFVLPVEFERVPFDLNLSLATAANGAVTGSANVEIDGSEVFAYTATGRHRATADLTQLKLRSTDPAVKTRFDMKRLELEEGSAESGKLRFRVSGQKGSVVLPLLLPAAAQLPGHGTCIRGGFCDVNQDTSALFTQPQPLAVRFDDTVFFGIVGAARRLLPSATED